GDKLRNRGQHRSSRPEPNADGPEISIGWMPKHGYLNFILGTAPRGLPKPNSLNPQPVYNLRHAARGCNSSAPASFGCELIVVRPGIEAGLRQAHRSVHDLG